MNRKSAPTTRVSARRMSTDILSEFQETVCELAGDMIVNGCHSNALTHLVYAVLAHQWGRVVDEEWDSAVVDRYIDQRSEQWHRKLTREWPAKHEESKEAALPNRAMDRFHVSARADLAELFESFAKSAQLDDVFLALEVFRSWEAHTAGPEPELQCHLADAFSRQIMARTAYIRVPADIEPIVRQYVKLVSHYREKAAAA